MSGTPIVVGPVPALAFFWADAIGTFDFAPLEMTLSDGRRWTREPLPPRLEFAAGIGHRRVAAGLRLGHGSIAIEAQVDVIRRGRDRVRPRRARRGPRPRALALRRRGSRLHVRRVDGGGGRVLGARRPRSARRRRNGGGPADAGTGPRARRRRARRRRSVCRVRGAGERGRVVLGPPRSRRPARAGARGGAALRRRRRGRGVARRVRPRRGRRGVVLGRRRPGDARGHLRRCGDRARRRARVRGVSGTAP